MCPICGTYNGRAVLVIVSKTEKAAAKAKAAKEHKH